MEYDMANESCGGHFEITETLTISNVNTEKYRIDLTAFPNLTAVVFNNCHIDTVEWVGDTSKLSITKNCSSIKYYQNKLNYYSPLPDNPDGIDYREFEEDLTYKSPVDGGGVENTGDENYGVTKNLLEEIKFLK